MSSAEAEYYAMTRGGAYALGTQAYLEDWRSEIRMLGTLSGSSAFLRFGACRGPGKMRHMEIRNLWLQDMIAKWPLEPKEIDTNKSPLGMLTKAQTNAKLEQVMEFIGQRPVPKARGPACSAPLGMT